MMRNSITIISIGIFLTACNPPADNSANEAFEKNSATVLAYLNDWEAESVDYDKYFAAEAWVIPSAVGSVDSVGREEMIKNDQRNWEALDFEIPEEISFLPGVSNMTKKVDGSVRYYGKWKITMPGNDSTEPVSLDMKIYQSFDFDNEGKIMVVQSYGDWGGMRDTFEDAMEDEEEMESEEEEME